MKFEDRSSLKAGIFVMIGGVLLVLGIIALGQRSQLLTKKYTLTTEFRNARGLITGADVRVAGVNAGTVRSIEIIRVKGEPSVVRVGVDVSGEYLPFIRSDSRASIRSLGALGDKYVEISLGTEKALDLGPNTTIAADDEVDFYELAEQMREALEKANAISQSVSDTMTQFRETKIIEEAGAGLAAIRRLLEGAEKGPGFIHTLLFDPKMPKIMEDFQASCAILRKAAGQLDKGEGDLGRLLYGDRLSKAVADVASASASAKRILDQIESGDGLTHALVYDPKQKKVLQNLASSAESLERILGQVEKGDSLAHTILYDAEQKESLNDTLKNLSLAADRLNALLVDVKDAKGTLGLFIADPTLWESMTRLVGGAEESKTLKFLIRRSLKNKKPLPPKEETPSPKVPVAMEEG